MIVEACDKKVLTVPPPYHLFIKLGQFFVFDTSAYRFYKIDEITYRLLELCLDHPIEESAQILSAEGRFPSEEILRVAEEVRLLARNGLFDVPDFSTTEEKIDRTLDQAYEAPIMGLELALAESCNLACKYCYCGTCRNMPDQGLMPEKVAHQAVLWLFGAAEKSKSPKVNITLFGGEPLLNKPVIYSLVAKVNLTDNLVQSFVWHEDELLALSDNTGANFSYLKDNYKNVVLLLDGQGEVDSSYAYSPFGRLDRATGSYSRSNPYTFSSEQRDDAVNLVYYHYRYYAPEMGRWISRDPIEENGGVNLFAFCSNTLSHDNYGLLPKDIENVNTYNASITIKGGVGLGGGAVLNIKKIIGDHCCKSGSYKNKRKKASEAFFGLTVSVGVVFGIDVDVPAAGITLKLILTGPQISKDFLNIKKDFDECNQVSVWHLQDYGYLNLGINDASAGAFSVSITASGKMGLKVGWDLSYNPTTKISYYKVGLYVTADVAIKGRFWIYEKEWRLPEKYILQEAPAIEKSGRF